MVVIKGNNFPYFWTADSQSQDIWWDKAINSTGTLCKPYHMVRLDNCRIF